MDLEEKSTGWKADKRSEINIPNILKEITKRPSEMRAACPSRFTRKELARVRKKFKGATTATVKLRSNGEPPRLPR
ncbi:hypothetical protein Hamer_G016884 [Homarus americanus]|uniref:Uncharacterized protein n=1 Tax=Homarus americanus TaxID=6706 RepID=A0A8J5K640_HOMAM|nr:hypothetical protein Hamer_G016884 [Homarus americanus]